MESLTKPSSIAMLPPWLARRAALLPPGEGPMIRVICTCGRAFKAEDRHAGKRAKCPVCGADLTVGPAPETRPGGSGADEGPSWWDTSGRTDRAVRGTAPTRSGSDPGPDAVNPRVLLAGHDHQPQPHASSPSPPTAASRPARVPPSKAPVEAFMQILGRAPSSPGNTGPSPAGPPLSWSSCWGRSSGSVRGLPASTMRRPHHREPGRTSRMTRAEVSPRHHRRRVAIPDLRRSGSLVHRPAPPALTRRQRG